MIHLWRPLIIIIFIYYARQHTEIHTHKTTNYSLLQVATYTLTVVAAAHWWALHLSLLRNPNDFTIILLVCYFILLLCIATIGRFWPPSFSFNQTLPFVLLDWLGLHWMKSSSPGLRGTAEARECNSETAGCQLSTRTASLFDWHFSEVRKLKQN